MNDIDAIDAVLRDEPVPAEHADLETLVRDVRATGPQIPPSYVLRLERRVEQGFPKERKRPKREGSLFAPALVLACTVLLAGLFVFVGVVDNGSDDEGGESSGSSAAPAVERRDEAVPELRSFGREADPRLAQGQSSGVPAPGRPRVVRRDAALALSTGEDDFADVTAGVLQIADDSGAIVMRSTVTERDGRGVARYDLRVPSSRLEETLADLSRLATVRSRTGSSDDITGAYVSARDRLDDARAERRALLTRLARADSENEADAIRASLRDARRRIALAERDVRRVRAQADRSRVSVTVESTGESGAWTPGDALDDAGRVLEVTAGIVLVVGAVLAPFAVLALLAAGGGRVVRRRRREAALRPGG